MPWGGTGAYVNQARELPLTVFVDADGLVRRIEVRSGIMSQLTLDLDTFEPINIDWTPLPSPTPGPSGTAGQTPRDDAESQRGS